MKDKEILAPISKACTYSFHWPTSGGIHCYVHQR